MNRWQKNIIVLLGLFSCYGFVVADTYRSLSTQIDKTGDSVLLLRLVDSVHFSNLPDNQKVRLFDQVVQKAEALNTHLARTEAIFYRSIQETIRGNYVTALQQARYCLESYAPNDRLRKGKCFNTMSNLMVKLGDTSLAFRYINRALELCKGSRDSIPYYVDNHLMLSYLWISTGQFRKADSLMDEVEKRVLTQRKAYRVFNLSLIDLNRAEIALGKEDYKAVKEPTEKLLAPSRINFFHPFKAHALKKHYLALKHLEDLRGSSMYLDSLYHLARFRGDERHLAFALEEMADHEKSGGAFQKAYEYLHQAALVKRKLAALDANSRSRYQSYLRERENKLNRKLVETERSNTRRKVLLGWIAAIIILVSLGGIFYFSGRNKMKREKLKQKLQLEQLTNQLNQSRLGMLRTQMNPHFIFNALNSIQEYIVLNKTDLASSYLGKFADLMRAYLDQSKEEFISLQEEIDTLTTYLEVEQIRFEDSLKTHLSVDGGIPTESVMLPPILLQPYVENAIKHGLLHKRIIASLAFHLLRIPWGM